MRVPCLSFYERIIYVVIYRRSNPMAWVCSSWWLRKPKTDATKINFTRFRFVNTECYYFLQALVTANSQNIWSALCGYMLWFVNCSAYLNLRYILTIIRCTHVGNDKLMRMQKNFCKTQSLALSGLVWVPTLTSPSLHALFCKQSVSLTIFCPKINITWFFTCIIHNFKRHASGDSWASTLTKPSIMAMQVALACLLGE